MPRLYGTKQVRVAAYNRRASKYFLELAETREEARFFTAQAALVYSAFTYEAFLNQLGKRVLKNWARHEWGPVQAKLKVICQQIGYTPRLGARPYQTIRRLFRFRNQIAHGRDETVVASGTHVVVAGTPTIDTIQADWERYCTVANARKAFDDVDAIARDLCAKAGISKFAGCPFGTMASSVVSIRP